MASARSDSSSASLSASARIAAPAFRRAASISADRTAADTAVPSLVKTSSAFDVSSSGRKVIVSAIATSVRRSVRQSLNPHEHYFRAGVATPRSAPLPTTTCGPAANRRHVSGSSQTSLTMAPSPRGTSEAPFVPGGLALTLDPRGIRRNRIWRVTSKVRRIGPAAQVISQRTPLRRRMDPCTAVALACQSRSNACWIAVVSDSS